MADGTRVTKLAEEHKKTNDRLDQLQAEITQKFDQMALQWNQQQQQQQLILDRISALSSNPPPPTAPVIQILPEIGESSIPPAVQASPGILRSPRAATEANHGATGGYQTTPYHQNLRAVRIDIPIFDGSNLENWLFQLDLYFECYSIPMDQRLATACLHLTGAAMTWYRWLFRHGKIGSWHSFVSAIRQRFGPSSFEDYHGQISKITQTGTVAEFIAQFEALADQVPDVQEQMLMSMFISGLKAEIKRELLLARPQGLFFAFEMARAQEAKFVELKNALKTSNANRFSSSGSGGSTGYDNASASVVSGRHTSLQGAMILAKEITQGTREHGLNGACLILS